MSLLLDTRVLLRWLAGTAQLTPAVRAQIGDPAQRVFVSVASGWETAIKLGLGKLPAPANAAEWLPRELRANRFTPLPIALHHALAVEQLPRHHSDPIDRLLIAQALAERLTLVTADPQFARYDPNRRASCSP